MTLNKFWLHKNYNLYEIWFSANIKRIINIKNKRQLLILKNLVFVLDIPELLKEKVYKIKYKI